MPNLDSKEPTLSSINLTYHKPKHVQIQKTEITYIFLEAPASTGLLHNNPTSLNALSTMAPLWAPVVATGQHLITGSPTKLHRSITRHSFINPFPTRARSLPLKGTLTTFTRMTPSLTNMLPTAKPLLTRMITLKNTITTLLLLFHPPTLAGIHATCPARRASATVANLSATVNPTIQNLGTRIIT